MPNFKETREIVFFLNTYVDILQQNYDFVS